MNISRRPVIGLFNFTRIIKNCHCKIIFSHENEQFGKNVSFCKDIFDPNGQQYMLSGMGKFLHLNGLPL